jgi:hypothetical protein
VRRQLALALLAAGFVFLVVPTYAAEAVTRYAVADGAGADASCTSTGANCSLKHVLEDVVVTGDEVIVMPGVHDVGVSGTDVRAGVAALNVHGQDGQPRPRITANSDQFVLTTCVVEPCSGNGTALRHLAVDNSGTGGALAFWGGQAASPLTIEDVHAVGGSAGLAILGFAQTGIISFARILNTTARTSGAGPNGSAITSEVDLTMRNVTAVATGAGADALVQTPNCNDGIGCTADANSVVLNTILSGGPGGADVRTTSSTNDCGVCFGNVLLDFSNFDSVANCAGCSTNAPSSANNQATAPLLVNVAGGDFHQRPGSPTIDAGVTDVANGPLDPDGHPRTIGAATDIGAFEDGHPRAVTEPAANVTLSGATLRGSVNPVGFLSTWYFEWGTTTAYGNRAPATDASAGDGTAAQPVSQDLAGLVPGTTVHYRLVAANSFGTVFGSDQSFTTLVPFAFTGVRLGVRVLVVRRGRLIRIPIPCPSGVTGSCAGRIRLVTASRVVVPPSAGASARRRKLTLGTARFSVPAGTTKRTRLRLSRPARRLVATRRRLRVVAILNATANATTKTTRQRVTVRNPRRR